MKNIAKPTWSTDKGSIPAWASSNVMGRCFCGRCQNAFCVFESSPNSVGEHLERCENHHGSPPFHTLTIIVRQLGSRQHLGSRRRILFPKLPSCNQPGAVPLHPHRALHQIWLHNPTEIQSIITINKRQRLWNLHFY